MRGISRDRHDDFKFMSCKFLGENIGIQTCPSIKKHDDEKKREMHAEFQPRFK
jgi:hypothetical protein